MNSSVPSSIRGFGSIGFLVTLGVVLAAFAALMIVWPWQTKTPENVAATEPPTSPAIPEPSVQDPVPSILPPDTTTTPSIDTSDWDTYHNREYGFELRYPLTLSPIEQVKPPGVNPTYISIGPPFSQVLFTIADTEEFKKDVLHTFNRYAALVDSPSVKVDAEGPWIGCSTVYVPNTAIEIEVVDCRGEGGPILYALIKGDKYYILFQGRLRDPLEKSKDVVIKMLSTFKFLD